MHDISHTKSNIMKPCKVKALSLHDSISLGEVELGLSCEHRPSEEEMRRLPLLLRLLSSSRPLSSIPTFPLPPIEGGGGDGGANNGNDNEGTNDNDELVSSKSDTTDDVIQQAVNRLEDRAALYSAAEGVEVVACHLAPYVCRKISRLAPLQRTKVKATTGGSGSGAGATAKTAGGGEFGTDELARLAANPVLASTSRSSSTATATAKRQKMSSEASDDLQTDNLDEDEDMADVNSGGDATATQNANNKRRRASSAAHESVLAAGNSEDSQEATVTKTLSELALLVVQSLQSTATPRKEDNDGGGGGGGEEGEEKSSLSLTIEDSILAEPRQGQGSGSASAASIGSVGGGAMVASDLGSMVVSLMHHAPVLRHRHVANALCRAAVPQAADLIGCMGANFPAAVPCLLRGCMDVCQLAQQATPRNVTIETVAKKGIMALADLSDRETSRVRTVLRQTGICFDLQLDLAIRQDALAAACLLTEHLSRDADLERVNLLAARNTNITRDGFSGSRKESVGSSHTKENDEEPPHPLSLLNLLEKSPGLMHRTLKCLGGNLLFSRSSENGPSVESWGHDSIFLAAYTWLMLRVRLDHFFKSPLHGTKSMSRVVEKLCSSLDFLEKASESQVAGATNQKAESALDRPFSLILCAMLTTLAQVVNMDDEAGVVQRNKCATCLRSLLTYQGHSLRTNVILARFASTFKYSAPANLRDVIEEVLLQRMGAPEVPLFRKSAALVQRLSTCSDWVSHHLEVDFDAVVGRGTTTESFLVDQSALLDVVKFQRDANVIELQSVRRVLKAILEDSENSLALLRSPTIPNFIETATCLLLRSDGPKIPLVLPLQIEKLAMQITLQQASPLGKLECQFLLQVLYCFAFADQEPTSPFRVSDFRLLPMREILWVCDSTLTKASMSDALRSTLKLAVSGLSPEIRMQALRHTIQVRSRHNTSGLSSPSEEVERKQLLQVLRKSMSNPVEDPLGCFAEKAFIVARAHLKDSDIFTTTAIALMSKPNSPARYVTYSQLCRDPLVLLKCPMNVWDRKGLRRIVLTVLATLLDTNESLVRHASPRADTRDEILAARTSLVVRCLITAMSSPPKERYCTLATGIIRKSIAKHRGLVGILLKQGVSEAALDWLVEFVPEAMDHSLNAVLSDRSSLNTAERLVAADGILRIAVAHGHRQPAESEALAYAALAQLIVSFFLVIGPVGVPVNTLVSGSGLDATQVSRRATFRMLKCLKHVRGYRTGLRNECGMALQKLMGLCKGESIVGGIANVVANRQKSLLKELIDAIIKAGNAMASGIQI